MPSIFNQALKNIYNSLVDVKTEIEPNLFNLTFNSLNKAVDQGFGNISYDHPDFDFVNELKYNNGVFAAFKTHRQQNDLAAQLLDENGELKTFEQFSNDTEGIIGDYNRRWLRTEYDTAVIRARMAARFKQFERDAGLYPNLKWVESTSVVKRDAHVKLIGLILPINHPFWTKVFPGNLWNCKCGITNTDEAENGHLYGIDNYQYPPTPAGLDGNPAVTGQIYSRNNAYEQNAYPGAEKALENFAHGYLLKFSIELLKEWRQSIHQFKGKDISGRNLATGNIKILRRTIDDVRDHNGNFQKIVYLHEMEEDISNWQYLGWKPVEHDHAETKYFNYYLLKIDNKKVYAVVKWHRDYKGEVLYCFDNYKPKGIRKGIKK